MPFLASLRFSAARLSQILCAVLEGIVVVHTHLTCRYLLTLPAARGRLGNILAAKMTAGLESGTAQARSESHVVARVDLEIFTRFSLENIFLCI